jgi:hypothetical protein
VFVDHKLRKTIVTSFPNFFVDEDFVMLRLDSPKIEVSMPNNRNFFFVLRISFECNRDCIVRTEMNRRTTCESPNQNKKENCLNALILEARSQLVKIFLVVVEARLFLFDHSIERFEVVR